MSYLLAKLSINISSLLAQAENTDSAPAKDGVELVEPVGQLAEKASGMLDSIQEFASDSWPNVISAILILIIGRWLAGLVKSLVNKALMKKRIEETIVGFTCNFIYMALITFVMITAIAQLGVPVSSFVAIIGAAGLAIGLALQGSLSNFAAGFLIVLFRPIKKGEFVDIAGASGTVEEIQIFTTVLKTPDNKTIIIPNGNILSGNIINYSREATRRVEVIAGVGYGDDIKKVKRVLGEIIAKDSRILNEPESQVVLGELADSSVNFKVRVWCKTEDYWDIFFDLNENIKLTFDAEGIEIPFPQRDVHIHNVKEE